MATKEDGDLTICETLCGRSESPGGAKHRTGNDSKSGLSGNYKVDRQIGYQDGMAPRSQFLKGPNRGPTLGIVTKRIEATAPPEPVPDGNYRRPVVGSHSPGMTGARETDRPDRGMSSSKKAEVTGSAEGSHNIADQDMTAQVKPEVSTTITSLVPNPVPSVAVYVVRPSDVSATSADSAVPARHRPSHRLAKGLGAVLAVLLAVVGASQAGWFLHHRTSEWHDGERWGRDSEFDLGAGSRSEEKPGAEPPGAVPSSPKMCPKTSKPSGAKSGKKSSPRARQGP